MNHLLDLPATGTEQDWEVELADSRRIEEWLDRYDNSAFDLETRSALFLLILCSILYAEEAVSPALLDRARAAMQGDRTVRARMKSYWHRFAEPSGNDDIDAENRIFLRDVEAVLS